MEARWWSDLLGGRRVLRKALRRDESATRAAVPPAGAGPEGVVTAPRGYSPKNVGNDASARPWESLADASHAADPAGPIVSSRAAPHHP